MSDNLQRLTTAYSDVEDRIMLAGEVGQGAPVVIWLTRRLLDRVIPAMLKIVQEQEGDSPRAELMQGFAQQAARAGLPNQAPVQAGADSTAWLAMGVDLTRTEHGLVLGFRSAAGHKAGLTLDITPLRQWLNILHDTYAKAAWPMDVWPMWLRADPPDIPQPSMTLH